MEDVIKDLLLNLLFLFIFLAFIPLLIQQSNVDYKYKKIFFSISACVGLVACMTFPLAVNEEIIYDLRLIASIIGSLYGGYVTAISLWLTNIVFRAFYGGVGIYSTLISSTTMLLLLIFLYRKFQNYAKKERMMMATFISLFAIIGTDILISIVHHIPIDSNVTIITTIIGVLATLSIIHIKEFIYETTLLKKEAMKSEKMAIVSQLASSISHEVKNPLTVVKGFLQLMKNSELPRTKQLEYLNLSIKELDKANNIISDYLSFAKPAPENKKNLNIKEELETIIELITPLAKMNGVEIKANLKPYLFQGDKQLFQQCIINITKNCIEAMPKGGTLTIETNASYKKIILEISDNGIGMTEEEVNRIGEPYYTTKGDKGTGLGMITSLNIIHSMNGTVHIESEKEKGTKFTIMFPLIYDEDKA